MENRKQRICFTDLGNTEKPTEERKVAQRLVNSRNPLPRPGWREERRAQCYQIQEAESFSGSWDHSGIHQWEVVTEEMQPVTKQVGLFLLS